MSVGGRGRECEYGRESGREEEWEGGRVGGRESGREEEWEGGRVGVRKSGREGEWE